MDLTAFVAFTLNTRFAARWLWGGVAIFVPVVNFLSLGYLVKASRLFSLGTTGLPTWDDRLDIWKTGARLFYIAVLYEALPIFLFSCGFFLMSFGNRLATLAGGFLQVLAATAFAVCSLFLPFAFCAFSERGAVKAAFEFERVTGGVKQVFPRYVIGLVSCAACLYIAYSVHRVPYLVGFVLSSLITYYVLLVATYYFSQLFKATARKGAR